MYLLAIAVLVLGVPFAVAGLVSVLVAIARIRRRRRARSRLARTGAATVPGIAARDRLGLARRVDVYDAKRLRRP